VLSGFGYLSVFFATEVLEIKAFENCTPSHRRTRIEKNIFSPESILSDRIGKEVDLKNLSCAHLLSLGQKSTVKQLGRVRIPVIYSIPNYSQGMT
jgi:hypothetical protein